MLIRINLTNNTKYIYILRIYFKIAEGTRVRLPVAKNAKIVIIMHVARSAYA